MLLNMREFTLSNTLALFNSAIRYTAKAAQMAPMLNAQLPS